MEYVETPDGSSSAQPVISPGPRSAKNNSSRFCFLSGVVAFKMLQSSRRRRYLLLLFDADSLPAAAEAYTRISAFPLSPVSPVLPSPRVLMCVSSNRKFLAR